MFGTATLWVLKPGSRYALIFFSFGIMSHLAKSFSPSCSSSPLRRSSGASHSSPRRSFDYVTGRTTAHQRGGGGGGWRRVGSGDPPGRWSSTATRRRGGAICGADHVLQLRRIGRRTGGAAGVTGRGRQRARRPPPPPPPPPPTRYKLPR